MKKFLLTRYQFRILLKLCIISTAPFAFLAITGTIENEAGLIMFTPFLAGFPWVLIYLLFDIPGFTSPASPGTSTVLTIPVLLLFMIPVYINIYFLVKLLMKDSKSHKNK